MLKLDEVEYTKRYETILSRLAPMQVYRDLDTMMRNYGASGVAFGVLGEAGKVLP